MITRSNNSIYSNDLVTILSSVSPAISLRLSDTGISTISDLLAHLTNCPRYISQYQWPHLKSKVSLFVKDGKYINSNTPLPTNHHLASNSYQSLHGANWEKEISNVS